MPFMKALALTVSLGQEYFLSFFFWLPWQPEIFMEFKSLKYSERASLKDHFCEVSLKSDWWFQRRGLFFINCLPMDGQTDDGH